MNFETLLPRVSAATLIRGLGRIHLNCFEIGYSKFNKNKPAWWYSCSLSPIQLGEAPWLPGLGLAKPECDGKMSVELPENSLSLAGWPARGSLPADSRSRPDFGTNGPLSPACPGGRGQSACLIHGQGPGTRECLKGKWMGCQKNNKIATLQLFREWLDFPNSPPQIQGHQTRRQL